MAYVHRITNGTVSPQINCIYGDLLKSLGSEEFGDTVRNSISSMTASVRRIYLFESKGREASNLCYFSGEPEIIDIMPLYWDLYMSLDPLHDAFLAAPGKSDMAFLRVEAGEIADPRLSAPFLRRARYHRAALDLSAWIGCLAGDVDLPA